LELIHSVIVVVLLGAILAFYGEHYKRTGRDLHNKYAPRISRLADLHQTKLLGEIIQFGQITRPVVEEFEVASNVGPPVVPSLESLERMKKEVPSYSQRIKELAISVYCLERPSRALSEIARESIDIGINLRNFGFSLIVAAIAILYLFPSYAIQAMLVGAFVSLFVLTNIGSAHHRNDEKERKLLKELEEAEEEMRARLGSAWRTG